MAFGWIVPTSLFGSVVRNANRSFVVSPSLTLRTDFHCGVQMPAKGGSDFPQKDKNAASPQNGMIDDDMGKYGGVAPKKVPKSVDKEFRKVAGGGSPGSYHGKKQRGNVKGPVQ